MHYLAALTILIFSVQTHAKTVKYELAIENKPVNMSGAKTVPFALTVNGGIPAPTLEFTEGDDAEIKVINKLAHEEVSLHWHGILLPPEEDGVAYTNTPPIHPGASRTFKFKIRQHGTFWYHSHTMLQEQKGVYGAFVIHPKKKAFSYDKEAVVLLSDWSDEDADQILRNLRKDGDFYLYKKDSVRSYFGALRAHGLKSHLSNEWQRMGGMDLSDVGYDAFLINGKRDSQLLMAHPGETVRLRIINAGASSYFYVAMGVPMRVVSADGVDIQPVWAGHLLMGMAETYDVLFTVPEHKNYELRATAQDVTGSASTWIGMGEKVNAPDQPKPDLYAGMDHSAHHGGGAHHAAPGATGHSHAATASEHAGHSGHTDHGDSSPLPVPPLEIIETLTVDSLRAAQPTTLPKDAKVHELKLVLGGDMERYVWHINGKTIVDDRLLEINSGEVVRLTFVNETMMHHPMHLHGHFFRVLNANGERSPLKHTVDVGPHSSRTIEFYANEPGQWMLHCHNLYHMKTGMARIVRYRDFKMPAEMAMHDQHDPHLHEHLYTHTQLEASTGHAKAGFRLMRSWDEIDLHVESTGTDAPDFSIGRRWDTEGDLVYRRWFSNYFNVFAGGTVYEDETFATAGVGYILPLLFKTAAWVNHDGKLRFDLAKHFQWTKDIFSEAEFTWRPDGDGPRDTEFEVSLMYGPSWYWAAGLMFTQDSVGAGAQIQF